MPPATPPTPRGSSILSRFLPSGRLIGFVAAAAAAIGVYFGTKLGDFGIGTGKEGIGTGDPVVSTAPGGTPLKSKQEGSRPGQGTTLDVIIDGDGYLLRQGNEPGEAISLNGLLEIVKDYPGGNDGIRVRIFRKGSSLPKAEKALLDGLEAAGVPNSSVLMTEGIVD